MILLLLTTLCQLDPPHPWDGFNEGSWVRIKQSITLPKKYDQIERITLVKRADDAVTVRVEQKNTKPFENPLPIARKPKENPWKDVGKETIEVRAKKYECTVQEMTSFGKVKRWVAKDAPGVVVKLEMDDGAGSKTTMTLVAVDEKVKLAGRDLKCYITETIIEKPDSKAREKRYLCDEVPGREAKREVTVEKNGQKIQADTWEVLDFEALK